MSVHACVYVYMRAWWGGGGGGDVHLCGIRNGFQV